MTRMTPPLGDSFLDLLTRRLRTRIQSVSPSHMSGLTWEMRFSSPHTKLSFHVKTGLQADIGFLKTVIDLKEKDLFLKEEVR